MYKTSANVDFITSTYLTKLAVHIMVQNPYKNHSGSALELMETTIQYPF